MLSLISVSVASSNFRVVYAQSILAFYILLHCIYFCCMIADYGTAYADTTLKMSTPEQRDHVVPSWFVLEKLVFDVIFK